jgi:uncharacterized protein (TIGR03435 family)
MRALPIITLLAALSAAAQTPAFEVASIKPSEPFNPGMVAAGKIHIGMKIDAARVDIGNMPLVQLIAKAYDVKMYQVSGPDWMKPTAQRFDIVATLPKGATKEQVPQMLQGLLKERFKMEAHTSTKDVEVYALVVGKGGLKIKESAPLPAPAEGDGPASTGSNSVSIKASGNGATVSDGEGTTQVVTMAPDQKSMRLAISGITMGKLAESLTPMVDRPIVDMTDLKGRYDVVLDVSMQDMMNAARAAGANVPGPAPGAGAAGNPADAASDPGGGSVFTAIQSLGLKLEKRKAPLVSIVVDKVEKMPTEN